MISPKFTTYFNNFIKIPLIWTGRTYLINSDFIFNKLKINDEFSNNSLTNTKSLSYLLFIIFTYLINIYNQGQINLNQFIISVNQEIYLPILIGEVPN